MVTRDEMKAEAIRRMKLINYYAPSKEAFRRSGKIMVNEPPLGAHYYVEDDLQAEIEKFEQENNALVYAVVRAFTEFGQLDSLLFIDQYKEDWNRFDEDAKDGYYFTYTINRDCDWCSEFGSIMAIRTIAGGLHRVA